MLYRAIAYLYDGSLVTTNATTDIMEAKRRESNLKNLNNLMVAEVQKCKKSGGKWYSINSPPIK